mmetsp:Transcript_12832/g.19510  ORF Transcript_12832/g.19510 Transcript_12832/m.19510 type:complete len:89 (+) Transcript_12832:129-395(+)
MFAASVAKFGKDTLAVLSWRRVLLLCRGKKSSCSIVIIENPGLVDVDLTNPEVTFKSSTISPLSGASNFFRTVLKVIEKRNTQRSYVA